MLHWISANLSTILITLVLIAIVVLIIRSLIRQKKQGKVLLRRRVRPLRHAWPSAHRSQP